MARQPTRPDRAKAKQLLEETWAVVLADETASASSTIASLINSNQTAIRFCLPTQLLGKFTDNDLDCLCLQRGEVLDSTSERWDPRGFASSVIVTWNRENQNVLGPSGDPYVSNPLRRPRVDFALDQMSDRDQWDGLVAVLKQVQEASDPDFTKAVFTESLIAIRERLRDLTFSYVIPERVSLRQACGLVDSFLAERSGGDRGLCIAAALFETIGNKLNLYKEIRRSVINAADSATKSVGDLACIDQNDKLVLAVEVKERQIGNDDVHLAIGKAREFSVKELIFCCDGIKSTDVEAVESTFQSAWASGTNLYQATIHQLMTGILPVLGEPAIKSFVVAVGEQLDKFSTQPRHRKVWKNLLDEL